MPTWLGPSVQEDPLPKVLIVDDDKVARDTYRAALEEAGFQVFEAENGVLGVAAFERIGHEVVIVDLVMPVMNGFKTIHELFGIDPSVRVIAVSGVSPEQLDRAEELGAARIMVKPIPPVALVEQVQSLLSDDASGGSPRTPKGPSDLPLL